MTFPSSQGQNTNILLLVFIILSGVLLVTYLNYTIMNMLLRCPLFYVCLSLGSTSNILPNRNELFLQKLNGSLMRNKHLRLAKTTEAVFYCSLHFW